MTHIRQFVDQHDRPVTLNLKHVVAVLDHSKNLVQVITSNGEPLYVKGEYSAVARHFVDSGN